MSRSWTDKRRNMKIVLEFWKQNSQKVHLENMKVCKLPNQIWREWRLWAGMHPVSGRQCINFIVSFHFQCISTVLCSAVYFNGGQHVFSLSIVHQPSGCHVQYFESKHPQLFVTSQFFRCSNSFLHFLQHCILCWLFQDYDKDDMKSCSQTQ